MSNHEILLPFTCVQSKGGAYDDDAFTAGWRMCALFIKLGTMEDVAFVYTVRREEIHQSDIIAMYYGLTSDVEKIDDEWYMVTFTKVKEQA